MEAQDKREFKVGDTVWDCIRHKGEGIVKNIANKDEKLPYPVLVKFDEGGTQHYTTEGYGSITDCMQTLYHQPYTITLQEIPEELPEVGTPVYVWDDDDTSSCIAFFLGKSGSSYETCPCIPFTGKQDRWQNMSLTLPDKFK